MHAHGHGDSCKEQGFPTTQLSNSARSSPIGDFILQSNLFECIYGNENADNEEDEL
jgi:hypothetical protein